MERTIVQTHRAPAAVGPYSQAVRMGDFIFCSGQIGLNSTTGKMASDDIQGQTKQVLENLKAVLEAAGSNMDLVVKTTIFLTDMSNFNFVNLTYSSYFPSDAPPARSTVAVKELPLDALIEIEAIAALPKSG